MKKHILAKVSIIALLAASPSFAQTNAAQNMSEQQKLDKLSDDTKSAIAEIKSDAAVAYEKIKAQYIDNASPEKNRLITIDPRTTANGIIGHPVYNEKKEKLGKVADIIVDQSGKATMIVVSDSSFVAMGKHAAFDYASITRVETDGDVIMPLTDEIIANAATFSYDRDESGDKVRVIPDNGYSVNTLLKGRLLNSKNEPVADIENISFKSGQASQLVIGFDKTLGFGGDRAALAYNATSIVRNGYALDFQLSPAKEVEFMAFKEAMTQ